MSTGPFKYPLAHRLGKTLSRAAKHSNRPNIVNEGLCDDVLHRLAPYLRRNAPLDIIDLWPRAGLWSSKVNDFLQPRRHILVEPGEDTYSALLKPLAESKPCYKLANIPFQRYEDWDNLIADYLPEQGPSNCDRGGPLAKNDTLLVLANPPSTASKRDHRTPARWWSAFMESCVRLSGLNRYGTVRVVAAMTTHEARDIIPRSLTNRRRGAILTESVASHAFEVAATHDTGSWIGMGCWDVMADSAAHVSKKTADNGVPIPAGREPDPILMAPQSPTGTVIHCPYVRRVRTGQHDTLWAKIQAGEGPDASPNASKEAKRAGARLHYDNRAAFDLVQLLGQQSTIDRLNRSLSRDATDPSLNFEALKPTMDKIEEIKAAMAAGFSRASGNFYKEVPSYVDTIRAVRHSGSFDDAVLAWYRRPFEPLKVASDELYPEKTDYTMLYFEPDANSPVMKLLNDLEPQARDEVFRTFDGIALTLGTRGLLSVADVSKAFFPDLSGNDLVRLIPSLASYAFKRPKPDFDSQPKTIRPSRAHEKSDEPLDPTYCIQDNLDYDFSDVRIRTLPTIIIWEIARLYQRRPRDMDFVHISRMLGGGLTEYRLGAHATSHGKR